MTPHNNSSTAEKQKTISIQRTFNLPLDTVWKAWTEPGSFKKWWGPEGYTCPYCSIDFRVGGKFLNSMKGPDGKEIWSTGIYKEIISLKKIGYTDSFADSKGKIVPAAYYKMPGEWPLVLIVTISFEEVAGKTNMLLRHSGLPVEAADDCMKGWQSCFDKLEKNLK
ncbi:MAG TPA: SRPBCC domain-containing protein [Chitinophagaceae bacterium]|nr:SRPBCC domain-containing protein [Chitinophagaceae bacterium]